MDEFAEMASLEREAKRIARRQWFWLHVAVYVMTQLFLITVWALSGGGHPWFTFSVFGWGIFLAVHGIYGFVMKTPEEIIIERAPRAQ